jgi:hypothetical protein
MDIVSNISVGMSTHNNSKSTVVLKL